MLFLDLKLPLFKDMEERERSPWGESQGKEPGSCPEETLRLHIYRGPSAVRSFNQQTVDWRPDQQYPRPNEFSVASVFVAVRSPEWQPCYCTSPNLTPTRMWHVGPTEALLVSRNRGGRSQSLGTPDSAASNG